MIEILKTRDAIRLNFLKSVLEAADIAAFIFEVGTWPGAFPARLMVSAEDEALARRLIAEAEADL